jgi:hypothetical protein
MDRGIAWDGKERKEKERGFIFGLTEWEPGTGNLKRVVCGVCGYV